MISISFSAAVSSSFFFFFFNDTATTEIYTLSLHDALPTSARADSFPAAPRRSSSELLAEASIAPAPLLLLLGTGWGLADTLIPSVSRVLAPIEGSSDWNHLAVRSAGAILLD